MTEMLVTFSGADPADIMTQVTFSKAAPFLMLETMETAAAKPILGRPTYVIVDRFRSQYDLNRYASGRMFDQSGELKWRREGATFRCVYIGCQATSMANSRITSLDEGFHTQETSMYLWGKKIAAHQLRHDMLFEEEETVFVELQIPQYLQYPVEGVADDGRVKVGVKQFYRQAMQLAYYRFFNLARA